MGRGTQTLPAPELRLPQKAVGTCADRGVRLCPPGMGRTPSCPPPGGSPWVSVCAPRAAAPECSSLLQSSERGRGCPWGKGVDLF